MRPVGRSLKSRIQFAIAMVSTLMLAAAVQTAPAAWAAASPSPAASPGGTTYRVGTLENVETLNPFLGYSVVDAVVYHLNYDYLTGYDPVKLQPRPEFAESWSHSPDGKTWTFKIRPGMTWQDGAAATARDVAFTFNYIIKNQLASYTFSTSSIVKVTAPDDSTAVFTCSAPKADILSMPVPIVPEHIWSKVSGKAAQSTFPNGPPCIGSGPYQVVQSKSGDFTRLEPNPHYWRGKPNLDELLFITYTNADTMVQDLKAGVIDGAIGVPPAQFKSLGSASIKTVPATAWGFTQLSFNCYDSPDSKGNPVLLDPHFRQALQYAVDRDAIASLAFGGYMDPGGTLLPPYSVYHWAPPSDQAYTFDPGKTKAMLDAAGYKDVDGDGFRDTKQGKPLTLRLYVASEVPADVTASKLVAGWLKDVGLKIHLETLDPGALTSDVWSYDGTTFTPDYDLMLYYWAFPYDPNTVLGLLTPDQVGAWSDTSWTDPTYTELFIQQSRELDQTKRIALVQQLQQIAYQASPYVIFGYQQQLEAYNSADWQGYVPAPSGFKGYPGAVLQDPGQVDTYIDLQPATASATSASSSSSTTLWIGVAVAAVVVLLLVVWLLRRRRGSEVEA
jgi:peptide/nickel transport system substrate-binding protein